MLIAAALPLVQCSGERRRRCAHPARPLRHPRVLPLPLDGAAARSDRDRHALRAHGRRSRRWSSRRCSRRPRCLPRAGLRSGAIPWLAATFDRRRASGDRSLRHAVERCDRSGRAPEHAQPVASRSRLVAYRRSRTSASAQAPQPRDSPRCRRPLGSSCSRSRRGTGSAARAAPCSQGCAVTRSAPLRASRSPCRILLWLAPDLDPAVLHGKERRCDRRAPPDRDRRRAAVRRSAGRRASRCRSAGRTCASGRTASRQLVLIPLVVAFGAAWGATGAAGAVLVATVVFVAFWTVLFLRIRREPERDSAGTPRKPRSRAAVKVLDRRRASGRRTSAGPRAMRRTSREFLRVARTRGGSRHDCGCAAARRGRIRCAPCRRQHRPGVRHYRGAALVHRARAEGRRRVHDGDVRARARSARASRASRTS